MPAPADTDRLLDLLREAGDEAVTLDELHVVGVQDPASALLSLELAGHEVHRVYEREGGRTRTCVRLATASDALAAGPAAPLTRAAVLPLGPAGVAPKPLVGGAAVALLAVLLFARR